MTTRRKYPRGFKQDAVNLVTEQGYKIAEASRNLGIDHRMLGRWVKAFQADETEAFRGHGKRTAEQDELHRLRLENKRLKWERDILKKATAFFANEKN